MSNRESDDELERMRAHARRGSVRQGGGSYRKPAQFVREHRGTRQSYDSRGEYDGEHYYGEGYGVGGDRQVDFSMEDYLDGEPPVSSRRLRSSHGSSGSTRRRQAQSTGSRQAQSGKSRRAGGAASNPDRARATQTISRNQRRAEHRRQDAMERGKASAERQQG